MKDIIINLFTYIDSNFNGDYCLERRDELSKIIEETVNSLNVNKRNIMSCMRLILCGSANGLSVADIMSCIGKDEVLYRAEYAVNKLNM